MRWLPLVGAVLLVVAFVWSFPPSTWTLIPFADDWVPRYQSTVDGIALLRRGAVVGWQWAFLGGYQTSADLSQNLTMLGFVPMTLLAIARTPVAEFSREMRKWGVRHLVVWSAPTRRYLEAAPSVFERRWAEGLWVQYEMRDADPRSVAAANGAGFLGDHDALGGTVRLSGVRRGDRVIVRQNYFPAWTAWMNATPVALCPVDGQLAFDAPADGDDAVRLTYPCRVSLELIAIAAFVIGAAILTFTCATPSSRSAAA